MIYHIEPPNRLIAVLDQDITSWPVEALSAIGPVILAKNPLSGLQKAIEHKPCMLLVGKKTLHEARIFEALKDHPDVTIVVAQHSSELELKSLLPLGTRFCVVLENIVEACSTLLALKDKQNPVFYHLRHFDDAKWLASNLARKSKEPHACQVALGELILNAIEHGNLNIGYDEKTTLIQSRTWIQEIEKRLLDPKHQKKLVKISGWKENNTQWIRIEDTGNGFDHTKYLAYNPALQTHQHGRGILIAMGSEVLDITFEGKGNIVVCGFEVKT